MKGIAIHLLFVALCLRGLVDSIRTSSEIPKPFIGNNRCRMIISELNIFPAGSSQYIELMRVCQPDPTTVFKVTMEKYFKIGFIDHSGFLIGVCSLKGEAFRRNGKYIFYTVGGSSVTNADMKISSCEFAHDSDYYSGSNFPSASKAPVAVALFYHPKGQLSWLELDTEGLRKKKVALTYSTEKMMVKYMVDMYVYTSSSPYTGCDYFAKFYEDYANGNEVILRDWAQLDVDRSLSRCNPEDVIAEEQWNPFQPRNFKYSEKTPNDLNKCSNAVKFRVEETQAPRVPPLIHFRTTPSYACYITTEDDFIDSAQMITSPAKYHRTLKELFEVPAPGNPAELVPAIQEIGNPRVGNAQNGANPWDAFEANLAPSSPFIWRNCDSFQPKTLITWLRGQREPHVLADDLLNPNVCYWIDYIQPNKFQCKLCSKLWDQKVIFDRPGSRNVKAVKEPRKFRSTESKSTKYHNRNLLDEHNDNPLHQISLDFFKLFDEGKRGQVLKEEFEREDGPYHRYLEESGNLFTAVFQSNRIGITFYKHPLQVELLKHFKIKIGHLYQTPEGDKKITMSISKTMHKDLVEDWKSRKPEMSILVDTATDVSSLSTACVLFATYDKNNDLVVKFYRLMKVTDKTESAEVLFNMFMKAIQEDGLEEWIKEKCVGFASDGGSNVRKFRDLLIKWARRDDIHKVHCFAHRLDLCLKNSWGAMAYLKDVDYLANGLHNMLNSRSHKKKEILNSCADQRGDKRFTLKRVIPTRWINSKHRSLSTVLLHWPALVCAIQEVLKDKTTTKTQRETAELIDSEMTDPTLIITMAFITDVAETLSQLNAQLQTRGTTLIGKKAMREGYVEKLLSFKTENGRHVQWFLDHATIDDDIDTPVRSIEEFEGNNITIANIEMNEAEESDNTLTAKRSHYIDSVIEEIDWYFPKDVTDDLDIFDPSQWPSQGLQHYGNPKLINLNEKLRWGFPPSDVLQDWMSLKEAISKRPDFQLWQTKSPEEFWQHYMNDCGEYVWPNSMKTILRRVLVVPATTAEVERMYSLYTNIKTVQRYNLDVESVEAILRLNVNGPKELSDFDALHYVKHFILDGHSRADDTSRRGKGRKRPREEMDSSGESEALDDVADSNEDMQLAPAYDEIEVEYVDYEVEENP